MHWQTSLDWSVESFINDVASLNEYSFINRTHKVLWTWCSRWANVLYGCWGVVIIDKAIYYEKITFNLCTKIVYSANETWSKSNMQQFVEKERTKKKLGWTLFEFPLRNNTQWKRMKPNEKKKYCLKNPSETSTIPAVIQNDWNRIQRKCAVKMAISMARQTNLIFVVLFLFFLCFSHFLLTISTRLLRILGALWQWNKQNFYCHNNSNIFIEGSRPKCLITFEILLPMKVVAVKWTPPREWTKKNTSVCTIRLSFHLLCLQLKAEAHSRFKWHNWRASPCLSKKSLDAFYK